MTWDWSSNSLPTKESLGPEGLTAKSTIRKTKINTCQIFPLNRKESNTTSYEGIHYKTEQEHNFKKDNYRLIL
jgi:hypothetical protein